MLEQLFRKKDIVDDKNTQLKRCLNAFDLTLLGIGCIIGTGIFVLTGIVAATHSGPAIIISFLIAGIACAFAALSYAELSSSIGTNLSTAISGVTFKIPVASTSTNDEVRDYKIVNSFFNTMVDTDSISGKILSIDENGSGKLVINMNGQEVEKQYKWEMDQTNKEIYLKTSIDVLNWGAQSSLDALNEVCLEQHTGPDGKNVLWPNVDITVIVDL